MYLNHNTCIFAKRMKKLSQRLKLFHIMVDSSYAISLLKEPPSVDKLWSVYLKVDCGNNRGTVIISTILRPIDLEMLPLD